MRSTIDSTRQPTMIRNGRAQQSGKSHGYLESLERRLADGYARIEDARLQGQDVTAWEEFWIELLHQYEAAVNDFPEAA
ncbi:MAG: hypothetical protein WKF63_05000 [Thermomicrobiales bacterium]